MLRFVDSVRAFNASNPNVEPEGFASAVWPAYISTIASCTNYFLTMEELLLVAQLSHQNVIIFREIGNHLQFAGAFLQAPGETVFVKLFIFPGQKKGHFERVLLVEDLQNWEKAVNTQHEIEEKIEACLQRERKAFAFEDDLVSRCRREDLRKREQEMRAMQLADEMSTAFRSYGLSLIHI